MNTKELKLRIKVMFHLIFESWTLAGELVRGMNHWSIMTKEINGKYHVLLEMNTMEYFK